MGVFEIAVLAALAAVAVAVFARGRRDGRQGGDGALAQRVAELAEHMKTGNAALAALAARLDRLAQSGQASQQALSDSLGQRLDGIGQRVGSSLHESTRQTLETMGRLQERLAAIDAAQQNIQSLGSQIVGLQDAATAEEKARAGRGFRDDVAKHIRDIADKYIVPGETADQAIMFLPSEAVYAELHARHGGVVEESFRRRVFIVSPTTLMATPCARC